MIQLSGTRILAWGLVVVAAVYVFAQSQQRDATESGAVIDRAKQALSTGKAYRGHLAKLKLVRRAHADTARSLQITIPPITLAMGPVELRGVAQSWQAVAVHWELADRADSTRADVAERRVADLEDRLAEVLTVADCHMLGVRFFPRCPSRTLSFVLGGVSGVTLVVVLTH